MANVIKLLDRENLQYSGVFNFEEFLEHARSWLSWRKFDIEEKRFEEKVKLGREYKIWWYAVKCIDEYSAIRIVFELSITDVIDVEVQIDKKKKKMQKGDINIYITSELITDRQDYWTQNAFFSFLRGFYDRYIYASTIDKLKGEAWNLGWGFFNELKSFLQLYKYSE
ncbi:MAG: hypothetical protein ACP5IJ_01310 [Candidatus Nanoarchaeia archaeon]